MTESEMIIPEGAKIEFRVPVSTKDVMQIEVLADGKPYAKGTILVGITGTYSFGTLKCAKGKRGIVFKPSFNFSLFGGSGISLGD